MTEAMTDSMPLRALVSFGGYSREELTEIIEKLNKLVYFHISASNNDVDIITEKLLYYTTPYFEALTLYFQSLKKPFYLLKSDLFYFIWCPGPLKFHIIQKFFGRKHKSIIIISQNFYGILPSVAKDEHIAAIIRIQFKI